jgi:uncharacterized glyoxalase superfamily protein PhnB
MRPNIFPVLRYDDAPRAIEFLIDAFGFEKASDHRTPDGRVAHADLRLGASVVGVSSVGTSPPGSPWSDVRQGIYIAVDDPTIIRARAHTAGARFVWPMGDEQRESSDFTLQDPEGYLWAFGTYAMERGDGVPTIFPEVLYRDADRALTWMEGAMGFSRALLVRGDDEAVKHAEMRLGDGVVFVGSAPTSDAFTGVTHFSNLHVPDVDAHFARAKAAGARIEMEPRMAPFGARFYAARDPEGFLWWVSTYAPGR